MYADIKKYVKIVGLLPNDEVLTEDKISKEKSIFTITLPSDKDVDAFMQNVKFGNSSRLGAADSPDLKLYNSQNLTAFDNRDIKLSELSDDVGSIRYPLVLTYVDRSNIMANLDVVYTKYLKEKLGAKDDDKFDC